MSAPTPFKIEIPDSTLDAIKRKVAAYEWHEMPEIPEGEDRWAYGTDMNYMREVCDYWLSTYDWRKWEAHLNSVPQFKTNIFGIDVHFIHVKGSGSSPQPLLLTHGWPGSVFEFYDVIEPLAHPEKFGGNAEDGVDLIIPSLPGFAFSGKPKAPVGPGFIAAMWDELMRGVLGYKTYIAQGGDWGSAVTGMLGVNHSTTKGGGAKAIHINMMGVRARVQPESEEEKNWAGEVALSMEREGAYFLIQTTKPLSLSYSMMDSPVGAAAWIIEKFHGWSDLRGPDGSEHIENAYTKDQLLTSVMIYLVTKSFNSASWIYRGFHQEMTAAAGAPLIIDIPVGVAKYARECKFLSFPPRSMMDKSFNLIQWSELDHGGHFAAIETGKNFANEVREFAKKVKSST